MKDPEPVYLERRRDIVFVLSQQSEEALQHMRDAVRKEQARLRVEEKQIEDALARLRSEP